MTPLNNDPDRRRHPPLVCRGRRGGRAPAAVRGDGAPAEGGAGYVEEVPPPGHR